MKAEKTEMVSVEFSKDELLALINSAIKAKYPVLLDEKIWQWDDFFIEKEIANSTFPDDKMAVFCMFSRNDSVDEKPLDNPSRVVYVDIHEVCR